MKSTENLQQYIVITEVPSCCTWKLNCVFADTRRVCKEITFFTYVVLTSKIK